MRQDLGEDPSTPTAVEALRQEVRRIKEDHGLSLDVLERHTPWSRGSWNRFLRGQGVAFPKRESMEALCRRYAKDDTQRLLALWEAAWAEKEAATTAAPVPAATAVTKPEQGGEQELQTAAGAADAAPASPAERSDPRPAVDAPAAAPRQPADLPDAAPAPAPGPAPVPAPAPAASTPEPTPTPAPRPETPEHPTPAASTQPTPAGNPKRGLSNTVRLYVIAAVTAVVVFGGAAGLIATTSDTGTPEAQTPGPTSAASAPEAQGEPLATDQSMPTGARPSTGSSTNPPVPTAPHVGATPGPDRTSAPAATAAPPVPASPGSAPQVASPAAAPTTPARVASTTGTAGEANCKYNWDRTQTMAKGMVGSKVKQIQCLLDYNYGQSLTVDGNFGSGTETAVKTIQTCSGLPADGQVGPETWAYLDHPKPTCGH